MNEQELKRNKEKKSRLRVRIKERLGKIKKGKKDLKKGGESKREQRYSDNGEVRRQIVGEKEINNIGKGDKVAIWTGRGRLT